VDVRRERKGKRTKVPTGLNALAGERGKERGMGRCGGYGVGRKKKRIKRGGWGQKGKGQRRGEDRLLQNPLREEGKKRKSYLASQVWKKDGGKKGKKRI